MVRGRVVAIGLGLLAAAGAAAFILKGKKAKPPAAASVAGRVDLARLADGLDDGLARDPFYESNADRLDVLRRLDELPAVPVASAGADERAARLGLLYLAVLGDIEALGAKGGDPAARAALAQGARRHVALARNDVRLLRELGTGFEVARYESNLGFLAAVAWLELDATPDGGCLEDLRRCARGPCDYMAAAQAALAEAPPDDPYGAGLQAYAAGDLAAAERQFTRRVEQAAGDGDALVWRGLLRLRQAQDRAALADFDAALRLAPDDATALEGRGHALFRLGDTAGAVAAWNAAADRSPRRAPTLHAYARAAVRP